MSRRRKSDEVRLLYVELPRFPAMGAASRIADSVQPELARAAAAIEAQRREYGDTPFLRIAATAVELARRELSYVRDDIRRWADADAARHEYPYGREE